MSEWLEDALAMLALIVAVIAGIWVAYGLGAPTGGAELLGRL